MNAFTSWCLQPSPRRPPLCQQARWMHPKQKGIVVPDFEGSRVSNHLHAAHKSATGADRQIVLWVAPGSYRLWMVISYHSLSRRFGFLRPLKWPGMAEISPLKGSSLGSSTKALLKKSSIYQFDSVIVHFRAGIARWCHDDLTSSLFGSDARVDTIACRVGIVASRTCAR